jgi:hypothetical protein
VEWPQVSHRRPLISVRGNIISGLVGGGVLGQIVTLSLPSIMAAPAAAPLVFIVCRVRQSLDVVGQAVGVATQQQDFALQLAAWDPVLTHVSAPRSDPRGRWRTPRAAADAHGEAVFRRHRSASTACGLRFAGAGAGLVLLKCRASFKRAATISSGAGTLRNSSFPIGQ